jgi:hypothetical protein
MLLEQGDQLGKLAMTLKRAFGHRALGDQIGLHFSTPS